VSCYDHEKPIGTISAPWYLMMEYFKANINGFQLGEEINKLATQTSTPTSKPKPTSTP
jgi:hypothetical protein